MFRFIFVDPKKNLLRESVGEILTADSNTNFLLKPMYKNQIHTQYCDFEVHCILIYIFCQTYNSIDLDFGGITFKTSF